MPFLRACLIILVACGPARPRAGDRTMIVDITTEGLTNDMHRPPENCEPCLREQRRGETLLSCALLNENVRAHWDTMVCFFEGP